MNSQSSFPIVPLRRHLVYTRAATARELKLKPRAKANISPRCKECIEIGLWAMLARNWRLLGDCSTLEQIYQQKGETRNWTKNVTMDKDFMVGFCSLARYIETNLRHFAGNLQEPNPVCPTKDGYKKTWLRKIENSSQNLPIRSFQDLLI